SDTLQVSDVVGGEGTALFEAASAQGLEGIVAKKRGSVYRPGRRSKDWLKIKTVKDADVVIGGWTPGEGSRSQTFGALLVGAYTDEGLVFLGAVGTGFSEATLAALMPKLRALEATTCPFVDDPTGKRSGTFGKTIRSPHWVAPELVATIAYRELTSGYRFRAPSFKGLRDDLDPADCLLSDLVPA
ncbi:MAG: ATP-dependent DNA ligase, partial [Actinomycetota bacterium]